MKFHTAYSITHYAMFMAVLVLVSLTLYGYFTWEQIRNVHADVEQRSRLSAREELRQVLRHRLESARKTISAFAQWEEVHQQLSIPHYYLYWRNHRMLSSEVLPAEVVDAEVYNAQGEALSVRKTSRLPSRLTLTAPPPYVERSGEEPHLLLFDAIKDTGDAAEILGYVALRMRFLPGLRENHVYRFLDPASIEIPGGQQSSIAWGELLEHVRFTLRPNPMGEAVLNIVSPAVLKISLLLILVTLILFPTLAYIVVRPLKTISTHIDRLSNSPGGLMLDKLGGAPPLAETEKIRQSLNSYQSKLLDVRFSLEQKSRELWRLAHHDALTGAANRRAFDEYLDKLPLLARDNHAGICFALFDVNHFKAINDSYGHQTGDLVLEAVAGRISSVLRKGEQLFRIGGDEFAAILLDCEHADAMQIAERCQEHIRRFDFKSIGMREPVKVSIGLAHSDSGDEGPLRSLHWQADVAMYQAKRPGHAHTVMFSAELARDRKSLYSSWINTAVFEAVTHGTGLVMAYQPIMDLRRSRVAYYEALARIHHENEWIMPSNIFPIVEARRLEVEFDRAIIERVRQDLMQGVIPAGSGVSINLSGPSLVRAQIEEWLATLQPFLSDYKVLLEVTETALITQIGLATENLARLRKLGFNIALDDFGSGYSSMRYLATMPVDTVKFDIALIRCLNDRNRCAMVQHLARMILELGHKLVAEGLEDAALVQQVKALGFDFGQGYYFGRPVQPPLGIADAHSAA